MKNYRQDFCRHVDQTDQLQQLALCSPVAEEVSVIFFSALIFCFVALSKSDEKLGAEKNITGGAPAPALMSTTPIPALQ